MSSTASWKRESQFRSLRCSSVGGEEEAVKILKIVDI